MLDGLARVFLAMSPSISADAIIPDPMKPTESSMFLLLFKFGVSFYDVYLQGK